MLRLAFVLLFVLLALPPACLGSTRRVLWIATGGHSPARIITASAASLAELDASIENHVIMYRRDARDAVVYCDRPGMNCSFFERAVPIEQSERNMLNVQLAASLATGVDSLMGQFVLKNYQEQVDETRRLIESLQPDWLVVDFFAFGPTDLAESLGIPYAVYYHCSYMGLIGFGDVPGYPSVVTLRPRWHSTLRHRLAKLVETAELVAATFPTMDRLNALRRDNGFRQTTTPIDLWLSRPVIWASFPGFDLPRYLSPLVIPVGVPLPEPQLTQTRAADDQLVADWLASDTGSRVVFAAFGTEAVPERREIDAIVQAAKQAGLRLVLALPSFRVTYDLPSAVAGGGDDNKNLHVNWTSQPWLLTQPQVAVFISHGGLSSVGDALGAEVPLLLLPTCCDRFANAARLQELGVAEALDPADATADNIAAKLQTLAAPSLRADYVDRMRWFKRVNRWAGNGAPGAARAVQSLLDIGYEHLIPLQDEIGFFAAYDLDILFAVLLALVLALLALLRCCCRCCCRRRASKAKQE